MAKNVENLGGCMCRGFGGRITTNLVNLSKTSTKNQWKPASFENFHKLLEAFCFLEPNLIYP